MFIFAFVIMLAEQGVVNGQLLIVLGTKGSTSQLEACGLETVGDQLRLKQLVDVDQVLLALPPHLRHLLG